MAQFSMPRKLVPIPYSKYKNAVRKLDRESVVLACARLSAQLEASGLPPSGTRPFNQWSLADIARVSLAYGGPQREMATDAAIAMLCQLHLSIDDPITRGDSAGGAGAILRIASEQFGWQVEVLPAFARTLLLFSEAAPWPADKSPTVMKDGWFERLLEVDLETYVAGVFIAFTAAGSNEGRFDLGWLDDEAFDRVREAFSSEQLRSVFDEHLSVDSAAFKNMNRDAERRTRPDLVKHSFNPLREKPFITDVGMAPLAPNVRAIVDKISPLSIFYRAIPELGNGFATDLGHVFEAYVGTQLRLLGDDRVIPEVTYHKGKNQLHSIDWFVQIGAYQLLIECKSTRPDERVRLGEPSYIESLQRQIGKGISQINETRAKFSSIVQEEPRLQGQLQQVGVVITLEDHFAASAPWIQEQLTPADLPVAIVSVRELEQLVTLGAESLETLVRESLARMVVNNVLQLWVGDSAESPTPNPIITSAFDSSALMQLVDGYAESAES